MKQTTLEDLYYGYIDPFEISFARVIEYGKYFDKSKYACILMRKWYNDVILTAEV